MKVLIVGSNGQLGRELQITCPVSIDMSRMDYPEIDITGDTDLTSVIDRIVPDWIVNCAAYTNVDGAEKEAGKAHAVNCEGAGNLARQALRINARLVHISTDYVFSGKNYKPYKPSDPPDPQSVYGRTKLQGESEVIKILGEDALIIRTAWLYSSHGNNFVKTMIRLMREKGALAIVDDQIGSPTWAKGLSSAVWGALEKDLRGVYHWTDAGVASWYDFAVAVQDEAAAAGILSKKIPIRPIPTEAYPTPAQRPAFSVLDRQAILDVTGLSTVHWRHQLNCMIQELV